MSRPLTVSDVMTRDVITVSVGTPFKTIAELFARHRVSAFPVTEAARLMAGRDITRLVVTEGDSMAGIVTRSDVLRAFLDSDSVVLHRVRREAMAHSLWDDPFGVEVKDGVVILTGELQDRSLVSVAVQAVREIDGVTGVENRLSYAFDDTVPASGPFY